MFRVYDVVNAKFIENLAFKDEATAEVYIQCFCNNKTNQYVVKEVN